MSFSKFQRKGGFGQIAILATALALMTFFCACNRELRKATIPELERAKSEWHKSGIRNYEIVVDVQGENDLRRNHIIVRNGSISAAAVRYWNTSNNNWDAETMLNVDQARPFTVPGLLETVEEEIRNSGRSDIRMSLRGDPPVPQTIFLGSIIHRNQAMEGTHEYIFVRKFSALNG